MGMLSEWMDDADAEWACRAVNPLEFWTWFPRLERELEVDAEVMLGSCVLKTGGLRLESGLGMESCPTHQSHTSQPTNVRKVHHDTTATDEILLS